MIVFPHCKINLGLHIVAKRPDGYHDLETVFYPIPLRDILEVVRAKPATSHTYNDITGTLSGLPISGAPYENLCVKAYRLLKQDFPDLPEIEYYLFKKIPMGAGLGGGSSDGTFMLKLLNTQFHLGLTHEQLLAYALQLGSDCPYFLYNQPCFAKGRGELLTPIPLDLSAYSIVLVHPGVHISTAKAFEQIRPAPAPYDLPAVLQQPVHTWKGVLMNDFETPAFRNEPSLIAIKEKLYDAGALYVSLTGSGSSFYGIFPKHTIPQLQWPKGYRVFAESNSQLHSL